MPITAAAIDRLKAQLLTSGVSQQNQALFQIINQLIDAVRQSLSGVESISGSGGGGGGLAAQSFITENDDTASLPNSLQIRPGEGIRFNQRNSKLIVSGAYPLSDYNPDYEEIIPVPLIRNPNVIAYTDISNTFDKQVVINAAFAVTDIAVFAGANTIIDILTVSTAEDIATSDIDSLTVSGVPINLVSGGIEFPNPQVASANARVLDDYLETPNWTPTIVSSGGGAPTYTTQVGTTQKVGNKITGTFVITINALGTLAAGNITIAGLPVAAGATNGIPFLVIFAGLATNQIYVYCVVNPSTTTLLLRTQAAAATNNVANLTFADLAAGCTLAGGFIYFT